MISVRCDLTVFLTRVPWLDTVLISSENLRWILGLERFREMEDRNCASLECPSISSFTYLNMLDTI
jgi:hypothetical protein